MYLYTSYYHQLLLISIQCSYKNNHVCIGVVL